MPQKRLKHSRKHHRPPANRQTLTLALCTEQYWDFIRVLRSDPRVRHGFITEANIAPEQQQNYMQDHWRKYFIALVNGKPAGFVGCVEGDIRICTHPDY